MITSRLTADRRENPIGLPGSPRLSWRLEGDGVLCQVAAWIQVVERPAGKSEVPTWDSGRIPGEASTLVPYGGPPLRVGGCYAWRVRALLEDGAETPWSAWATFELATRDIERGARWIGQFRRDPRDEPTKPGRRGPPPIVRRSFTLPDRPRRARLSITALGLHDTTINGLPVTTRRLTPRWTDYRRRIEFDVLDVTDVLQPGENVIASALGDGWYAGRIAIFDASQYGDEPALRCHLDVLLDDDTHVVVRSNRSWRASTGGVRTNSLLDGETFDARAEPAGWTSPGFDDTSWDPVDTFAGPGGKLVPSRGEGIRVIDEWAPTWVHTAEASTRIVDTGQNLAGVLRVRVPAGGSVQVRHGEALEPGGALYTGNLGDAAQTDHATATEDVALTFEPRFTYHGFRYAELSGDVVKMGPADVTVRVLSSATRMTGSFECSDPLLDRLQQNIQWSLRSNFLGIPTDCPQRDERLGWTADAGLFADTALFNADVAAFLDAWLDDLVDAQASSGAFPDIAPAIGVTGTGNAGWADAGISIPWSIFERTGDRAVLERMYGAMRRFLRFLALDHSNGIRGAGRYGDWFGLGQTAPSEVVGTAYLSRTARQFARIADALMRPADARRANRLADLARNAFQRELVSSDGVVRGDTQTGYVLALAFDLIDGPERAQMIDRLVGRIEAAGGHPATGFLGTAMLLPVLSEHRRHDVACQLIQDRRYPSWLYPVVHGATTTWERWDGWTEERGFADPTVGNSFNHYALGAVGDWLYRVIGGLAPDEPGYRTTLVAPRPGGTITWATTRHESLLGEHLTSWALEDDVLRVDVAVPANARARVLLPGDADRVTVNGIAIQRHSASWRTRSSENGTTVSVGPGRFRFQVEAPNVQTI